MKLAKFTSSSILALALVGAASAQFNESEPNDDKASANVFSGLAVGATITGNSTANTGAGMDYYRISTAADALGIYRYRLVLTSATVGHTGTIRGLSQTGATAGVWDGSSVGTPGTADNTAQSSFTDAASGARVNQWYSFGGTQDLYYRVTGTISTTADYVSTLERTTVTPVDLGSYNAGSLTITTIGQGHTTDTDLWVYDSNLNPILGYGNDDASTNGGAASNSTQSILTRNYAPGTYYLALSNFNVANNMTSPNDDNFRTGTILDFGGSVLNSSATLGMNVSLAIGGTQFAATKVDRFDIYWGQFTVVPEPATMAVLGLGILPLLRRRRKASK